MPLPYTRVLPLRDRAVYLPDVRGSDADYTGISIVDGGVEPAACRLSWLDGAGVPVGNPNPLNPLNLALSPGQLAINMAGGASGFFGVSSPDPGWVRLGSDAPVQAFSLNGDFSGQYLDGTPALADLSTRWLAPAVVNDWGAQNRLVVINPMASPASFLLELHHYNTSGVPAATSSGWYVPARGQLEVDLATAFPTQYVADTDYVLLRASAPVAAASQMAAGDFLAVLALQPQRDILAADGQSTPVPAPADLFVPQFAVGGGWWTRLALLNADPAAAADVVLTAFYTVGDAPLSTEVTLHLNPGEKRAADVQQLFGLSPGGGILDGWIRVRCSRGLVQGAVLYGSDSGDLPVGPAAGPRRAEADALRPCGVGAGRQHRLFHGPGPAQSLRCPGPGVGHDPRPVGGRPADDVHPDPAGARAAAVPDDHGLFPRTSAPRWGAGSRCRRTRACWATSCSETPACSSSPPSRPWPSSEFRSGRRPVCDTMIPAGRSRIIPSPDATAGNL